MKQKVKYVFFIILLMVSFLAAEEYQQKSARSFTLTASGSVDLANINGEIEITTTSGRTVNIKVVKKSDYKGEIENVEIIFEADKDTLKVYTKYNKKNTKAKVDFTVSIPEKLAQAGFKSVNGEIDCSGQFADLTLKTVNGKIDFQGEFQTGTFKTVNGSIDNDFGLQVSRHFIGSSFSGKVNGGGHKVKLETVNGRIKLSKI